jgi:hypothetical protein
MGLHLAGKQLASTFFAALEAGSGPTRTAHGRPAPGPLTEVLRRSPQAGAATELRISKAGRDTPKHEVSWWKGTSP